ncbi:MAG: hypothetical protein U0R71_14070 [Solirubrobacterales bacterium]
MNRFARHLTYANVMVTLLAFVVLCGGAAYAATQLGKGSVGTRQLKPGSVTGAKVRDGTLRERDLASSLLRSLAGAPGPTGPTGPAGEPGVSHAYERPGSVNYDKLSASLYGSTVISLPVPAGAYFATASAEAQTVNNVASTIECRLIDSGGSFAVSASQIARADMEPDSFTLSGLFQLKAAGSIQLQCSKAIAGSSARVIEGNLVAVQVSDATYRPE